MHDELMMERSAFLSLPQGLRITKICQEETGLLIEVLSEHEQYLLGLLKEDEHEEVEAE